MWYLIVSIPDLCTFTYFYSCITVPQTSGSTLLIIVLFYNKSCYYIFQVLEWETGVDKTIPVKEKGLVIFSAWGESPRIVVSHFSLNHRKSISAQKQTGRRKAGSSRSLQRRQRLTGKKCVYADGYMKKQDDSMFKYRAFNITITALSNAVEGPLLEHHNTHVNQTLQENKKSLHIKRNENMRQFLSRILQNQNKEKTLLKKVSDTSLIKENTINTGAIENAYLDFQTSDFRRLIFSSKTMAGVKTDNNCPESTKSRGLSDKLALKSEKTNLPDKSKSSSRFASFLKNIFNSKNKVGSISTKHKFEIVKDSSQILPDNSMNSQERSKTNAETIFESNVEMRDDSDDLTIFQSETSKGQTRHNCNSEMQKSGLNHNQKEAGKRNPITTNSKPVPILKHRTSVNENATTLIEMLSAKYDNEASAKQQLTNKVETENIQVTFDGANGNESLVNEKDTCFKNNIGAKSIQEETKSKCKENNFLQNVVCNTDPGDDNLTNSKLQDEDVSQRKIQAEQRSYSSGLTEYDIPLSKYTVKSNYCHLPCKSKSEASGVGSGPINSFHRNAEIRIAEMMSDEVSKSKISAIDCKIPASCENNVTGGFARYQRLKHDESEVPTDVSTDLNSIVLANSITYKKNKSECNLKLGNSEIDVMNEDKPIAVSDTIAPSSLGYTEQQESVYHNSNKTSNTDLKPNVIKQYPNQVIDHDICERINPYLQSTDENMHTSYAGLSSNFKNLAMLSNLERGNSSEITPVSMNPRQIVDETETLRNNKNVYKGKKRQRREDDTEFEQDKKLLKDSSSKELIADRQTYVKSAINMLSIKQQSAYIKHCKPKPYSKQYGKIIETIKSLSTTNNLISNKPPCADIDQENKSHEEYKVTNNSVFENQYLTAHTHHPRICKSMEKANKVTSNTVSENPEFTAQNHRSRICKSMENTSAVSKEFLKGDSEECNAEMKCKQTCQGNQCIESSILKSSTSAHRCPVLSRYNPENVSLVKPVRRSISLERDCDSVPSITSENEDAKGFNIHSKQMNRVAPLDTNYPTIAKEKQVGEAAVFNGLNTSLVFVPNQSPRTDRHMLDDNIDTYARSEPSEETIQYSVKDSSTNTDIVYKHDNTESYTHQQFQNTFMRHSLPLGISLAAAFSALYILKKK